MNMKENISLCLSVIAIVLSIFSIVIIEPFRFTNDSILGASLAIVSICAAIVVAYQITNSITIDGKVKKIVREEYNKCSNELAALQLNTLSDRDFNTKLDVISSLAILKDYSAVYPIAVSALQNCVISRRESDINAICLILKSAHNEISDKENPRFKLYLKNEMEYLKELATFSESAFNLLSSISRSEQKQQEQ